MTQFTKFTDTELSKKLNYKSANMKLNDLINNSIGNNTFRIGKNDYSLNGSGFSSLYNSDSILPKYIQETIQASFINSSTKNRILLDYSEQVNLPIKVYFKEDSIDSVVSLDESNVNNEFILSSIVSKLNVDSLYVSDFDLKFSPEILNLRLIDKESAWSIGDKNYYPGIHIYNNLFTNKFNVYTCLTNIYCFNTTLSKCYFNNNDNKNYNLLSALDNIKKQAQSMYDIMTTSQEMSTKDYMHLLNTLTEALKLPQYVKNKVYNYMEMHNTNNSLYDIIEAITYGTQEFINKDVNFYNKRTVIESKVFNIASKLHSHFVESGKNQTWQKYYRSSPEVIKSLAIGIVQERTTKEEIIQEITNI